MYSLFTSENKIEQLKQASKISVEIFEALKGMLLTDTLSPKELNSEFYKLAEAHGVKSSFRNEPGVYSNFPSDICVMKNSHVVHGIPADEDSLTKEDIVHLDMGIIYDGVFTDHGASIYRGEVNEKRRLVDTVKLSVEHAIKIIRPGIKVGDISFQLQTITEMAGYSSLKNFCGHGIGTSLHEDPKIPFSGKAGTGTTLEEGMVLAIENWITPGSGKTELLEDGWTLKTQDDALAAFFEVMVLVTKDGYIRLT